MIRQFLSLLIICVLASRAFEGLDHCEEVTHDQLSFCFAVNYSVAIYSGESVFSLDRQAQAAYLGQHDFGIQGGCNNEARDLICANFFPRCSDTTPGANFTIFKPCRKLCKDFKDCFKVEGDCDEDLYNDTKDETLCTIVKSDAASMRLALLALVAAYLLSLMW